MPSASFALQKAVHAALSASPELTALIGPDSVFDDVPRGRAMPYVTIAQTDTRDWSTGTEPGDEHTITIHAWSTGPGRRQTLEILSATAGLLHDAPLTLDGHRLVNLRREFIEARRAPDGAWVHGVLRLRAVTEPLT